MRKEKKLVNLFKKKFKPRRNKKKIKKLLLEVETENLWNTETASLVSLNRC